MNKKLFFGMFAAAGMLLATSCSHEDLIEPESGDTATVSFVVDTEGAIDTRAIGDGSKVNKLYYVVYNETAAKTIAVESVDFSGSKTLELTLAKGQTYKLGFYAAVEGVVIANNEHNDYEITFGLYHASNNNDNFDAFAANLTHTVSGNELKQVTLKRILAQVNVGIKQEDFDAATTALGRGRINSSMVELQGTFGTKYSVLGGNIIETSEDPLTLHYSPIPADSEVLTVNGENYKYLLSTYVMPAEIGVSQTVDAKFSFTDAGSPYIEPIVLEDGVSNLPIKSNYRTNIIGNVLTSNVDFKIVVDPAFAGEHNSALWDGSSVSSSFTTDAEGRLHIKTAEDFALLMSSTRDVNSAYLGKTFVLDTDIDFAGQTIAGVGSEACNFAATFDGNGHTISNFVIDQSGRTFYGGLFNQVSTGAVIKNLTVTGATVIANKMAGVIASNLDNASIESCHVENCVVIAKVKKAGAITGYTAGGTIKNCSAKDVQVYCADPAEADEIVGYINPNFTATITDNTAENVTVSRGTVTIATAAELAAVLNSEYIDSNEKYVLVNDIDLQGQAVSGVLEVYGTFDGNGHTISNVSVSKADNVYCAGLFNFVCDGGIVKNLTVKNASMSGWKIAGVIAGGVYGTGVVDACHVENSTVVARVKKAGAVIGYVEHGTIKNCTAKNVSVYSGDPVQAGEIVGYVNEIDAPLPTVTGNTATNVSVVCNAVFVSSAEQFATLGENNGTINGVVENKNIVLTKDIDLSGVALTPLRLDNSVFDGNGHKLTNVTAGEYGGRKSIFNGEMGANYSTVKNLTIDGVTVDGGSFGGVLFGDIQNSGTIIIDGVHIKNAVVKNAESVGAFIGFISSAGIHDVTIKNSSVENATVTGTEEDRKIGAIVGRAVVDWTLDNVVAKNVNLYHHSTPLGDVRVQGTKSEGTCNGTLTVR